MAYFHGEMENRTLCEARIHSQKIADSFKQNNGWRDVMACVFLTIK